MCKHWRNWRVNRRVKKMGFTAQQWEAAIADWPVAQRYRDEDRLALQAMSFQFLAQKTFVSGAGFPFTDAMCLKIATMACVPVLHLGLEWYPRWKTIVLYEAGFVTNRPYRTDDGVVHPQGPGLSGEAWYRGPVILSWQAITESGAEASNGKASNVVIHEVAHKLDMLRDGANGAPPMHPDMHWREWRDTFAAEWQRLQDDLQHQRPLPINAYGLTSPAEFFAVCSETFFEAPEILQQQMPNIYQKLCKFYRQQPTVITSIHR